MELVAFIILATAAFAGPALVLFVNWVETKPARRRTRRTRRTRRARR